MSTATRVGAFGAGLLVVFGAALGLGRLVGPLDGATSVGHPRMTTGTSTDHGDGATP